MRAIFLLRAGGVMLAMLVAAFVSLPSPNSAPLWSTTGPAPTVDRTLKGDRLPVGAPAGAAPREVGLPAVSKPSQPTEKRSPWCEGAFGPTASPQLQGVLQRCMV
jgi:hypothetical protein